MKVKKKDSSSSIHQRTKIKDVFEIRNLEWTQKQKEFIKLALDKETKLLFVKGPAGSSKSILAVYCLLHLLNEKRVSDILYARSVVESADSKIGMLPGEISSKVEPYILPLIDKLDELVGQSVTNSLINDKRVEGIPINFVRGLSWNARGVCLDEAQNCSYKEIITLITRLGMFSKCFVLADVQQTDLPPNKAGGFEKLFNVFNDQESKEQGIFTFEFSEEDIVRSPLVRFIVKKTKNS